jgi:hypothetical protein
MEDGVSNRDDADYIRGRLNDELEHLLDVYTPGWIKRGNKAHLTPKSAKDLGSWQMNLAGPRRGQWYRFSQRIGGGSVELLSYVLTNGVTAYAQAFKEARAFLRIDGEVDQQAVDRQRKTAERQRKEQAAKEERKKVRRASTAAEIWSEVSPVAGTLAETYLHGRGIPTPPCGWPSVIGFHDGLEWEPGAEWVDGRKAADGPIYPCLVGKVEDISGEVCAVSQIYLDPLTAAKADIEPNKVTLGPAKGGAVRIGGISGHIGIGEGIETCLAAWWLNGLKRPVWATLGTSGLASFEVPLEVERLTIFPDSDPCCRRVNGEFMPIDLAPGAAAAKQLRDRMQAISIRCTTAPEPPIGCDYLDVWKSVHAREMA